MTDNSSSVMDAAVPVEQAQLQEPESSPRDGTPEESLDDMVGQLRQLYDNVETEDGSTQPSFEKR